MAGLTPCPRSPILCPHCCCPGHAVPATIVGGAYSPTACHLGLHPPPLHSPGHWLLGSIQANRRVVTTDDTGTCMAPASKISPKHHLPMFTLAGV